MEHSLNLNHVIVISKDKSVLSDAYVYLEKKTRKTLFRRNIITIREEGIYKKKNVGIDGIRYEPILLCELPDKYYIQNKKVFIKFGIKLYFVEGHTKTFYFNSESEADMFILHVIGLIKSGTFFIDNNKRIL